MAAVATENSWLPLTASVLLAVSVPAATFWIWRSAPGLPTDTVPAVELAACTAAAVLPVRSVTPAWGAAVTEPLPKATSFLLVATAFGPMAMLSMPVAVAAGNVELAAKYWLEPVAALN